MGKNKRQSTLKDIMECVINYLGKECNYCGSTENLHIHHILPLSKGGQNSLGNLEMVCRACHLKLHHQIEKILPKRYFPVVFYCNECGVKFFKNINQKGETCQYCKRIPQLERQRFLVKGYMERKNTMIGLKKKGKTYEEIGKTFNLSRQRIHQIVVS